MFRQNIIYLLVVSLLISAVSIGAAESNYVVVPAQKTFISAESRLKDLSKKAEEARTQSGIYGVGLGLLYIGLGAAYGKSSYGADYSTIYYALGGGMALMGFYSLMNPTALERDYSNIRSLPAATLEERGARETKAEKVIKSGAEEAEQTRRIVASVMGVGGLVFMGSSPISGVLLLGLAGASYIMKSEIEKAYDEYLADKEEYIKSSQANPVPASALTKEETELLMLATQEAR